MQILTYGDAPYRELSAVLPKNQNFARELALQLEKGHRLRQPNNCSQELYQELLNCTRAHSECSRSTRASLGWLIDPESRPTFRQLKAKFETFCRAPHLYIQASRRGGGGEAPKQTFESTGVQDRQAAQQMNSISDSEQRAMIERLLQDSDFMDPLALEPSDYACAPTRADAFNGSFSSTDGGSIAAAATTTAAGRVNAVRPSNTTVETFVPDTPTQPNFVSNPVRRLSARMSPAQLARARNGFRSPAAAHAPTARRRRATKPIRQRDSRSSSRRRRSTTQII